MKKCFCGGNIEIKKVEYKIVKNGKEKVFKDVPAYVCQKCGAIYYDTDILDAVFKGEFQEKSLNFELLKG
ncbi:YgiT-type zinc finger protein [Caldanaerobacter sp.]|uniref:YgiT-type zinc finger protein n=1 Tax=Caldanaerobacter sp. TaxID=2930036 RepID=UPI003C758619